MSRSKLVKLQPLGFLHKCIHTVTPSDKKRVTVGSGEFVAEMERGIACSLFLMHPTPPQKKIKKGKRKE
jgi:hypothetical protein